MVCQDEEQVPAEQVCEIPQQSEAGLKGSAASRFTGEPPREAGRDWLVALAGRVPGACEAEWSPRAGQARTRGQIRAPQALPWHCKRDKRSAARLPFSQSASWIVAAETARTATIRPQCYLITSDSNPTCCLRTQTPVTGCNRVISTGPAIWKSRRSGIWWHWKEA